MRNSLARKVTADAPTGTEAATPAQGTAASPAASPVHALQERLWEEYLCKLEAAGYTRESGRDAPMIKQGSGCATH